MLRVLGGPRWSQHTTFSWLKQVIGLPRFKVWGNRFLLFSERRTIKPRGKDCGYKEGLKKFGVLSAISLPHSASKLLGYISQVTGTLGKTHLSNGCMSFSFLTWKMGLMIPICLSHIITRNLFVSFLQATLRVWGGS